MRALALPALAIATLAAIAPVQAQAYDIGRHLAITQTSDTDFTVRFRFDADLTDYWCAAGNFITNTKRMPDRTRVYRASPAPRKAGQGVDFTLDPARSSGATGITTFGGVQDGGMSAGGAVAQFCHAFQFERF